MSRLFTTFTSGLSRAARDAYRRFDGGYTSKKNNGAEESLTAYGVDNFAYRESLLRARAYLPSANKGYREKILTELGRPCKGALVPYYNGFKAVVGVHANALGGSLDEIGLVTPKDEPLPPVVDDVIHRIARWSNLDGRMQEITTLTANQGTTGIRVVGEDSRIYLDFDHPRYIADGDVEEDNRGNVINILLKYKMYYQEFLGGDYQEVDVEEWIGKDRFSKLVGGVQQLTPDEQVNRLGVCPYVVMRHDKRKDEVMGVHAYAGSEIPINSINWALSQLDSATARVMSETVLMGGAGEAPDYFKLGGLNVFYTKLAQGVPPPIYESIVPQLAISEVAEVIAQNIDYLKTNQPELVLTDLKLLAGTSGETLAQLKDRAEAAILKSRRNYEDALTRAIQIGMSLGILQGIWDLGTGTGTAEAADRAYDDGQGIEAFRFRKRPALPMSSYQKVEEAKAAHADKGARIDLMAKADGLVDRITNLVDNGGYTLAEATKIAKRQQEEASLEDPGDGEEEEV